MKKVKLALETLKVESFEPVTRAEKKPSGTVFGHATLVCTDQYTCTACDDDQSGMGASCGATCGGVCGPQTYAMNSCYWYQCSEM